ncbi:hypothetical protein AG1IA_00150 [Rhizoctonia solani AG-1 IA]|uniref:BTB domain-containing protein n=1 Tax=Thanatephorus cucumeris (strain AG1-IA) TaxID=983506 RepID=L8X6K9_THACA|nr:hypothetical protein AG1IA_00150 [Rhizoctonia solani AG-1 IA]
MLGSWGINFSASPESTSSLLGTGDEFFNMSDSATVRTGGNIRWSRSVEEPRTVLSISTTFYPGAPETEKSDLWLSSSDGVFFFVQRSRLLEGSSNLFGGLLLSLEEKRKQTKVAPSVHESPIAEDISILDPTIDLNSISAVEDTVFNIPEADEDAPPVIPLCEEAALLNIILLIIYRLPMERYRPDLQLMCRAAPALVSYGYRLENLISPASEAFRLLIAHSITHPLVVYALAAAYNLDSLAVASSRNTLGIELSQITDDLAGVMGPIYLRRTDALKRLLLEPPAGHMPLPQCGPDDQKSLTRAWALAIAYMTVEAKPNTHATMISSGLSALGEHLECQKCRACLDERIQTIVQQWSMVGSTI